MELSTRRLVMLAEKVAKVCFWPLPASNCPGYSVSSPLMTLQSFVLFLFNLWLVITSSGKFTDIIISIDRLLVAYLM